VSQQAEGLKRQRDVLQLELDVLERESINLRSAMAQKSGELEMERCNFLFLYIKRVFYVRRRRRALEMERCKFLCFFFYVF
jgi:hypothetical protein